MCQTAEQRRAVNQTRVAPPSRSPPSGVSVAGATCHLHGTLLRVVPSDRVSLSPALPPVYVVEREQKPDTGCQAALAACWAALCCCCLLDTLD